MNVNPGTAQTLLQIGPQIINNGAIVTNTNEHRHGELRGQPAGAGRRLPADLHRHRHARHAVGLRLATLSVQNAPGVTIDPGVSALNVNRVNAFYGAINNSDKISIGAGDATALVVQRGATGIAFPAGSFAQSPRPSTSAPAG